MNNGRMWCVVNPTVGIPIFLGAVALTSMTVHHAILNNTTWVKSFLQGGSKTAMIETAPSVSPASLTNDFTINVTPAVGTSASGGAAFVVTVSPKAPKADLTLATAVTK